MLFRRVFIAVALASAVGRAEVSDPRIVARYKQMLESNPAEGIAVERLWKSAVEAGSTEKLIAEFRERKTFASAMVLGHFLRRSGKEDDAVAAFARAEKLDAASPLPHLARAKLETERTRPREAALALEKACSLSKNDDPRLGDTLLQLGAAWAAAGEPAAAAKAWERTVAVSPNDFALRRRLADSYAAGLLYDAAIGHLRFIAEHGPVAERAAALAQTAKLHSSAGRPAEAMLALEQAAGMTAPGNWLRTELNGQMIRLAQRQHIETALEERWRKDAEANPRDLGAVLRLHRERKARATIVLTPVDNPSAYGLVETDADGNIRRFLEKPKPEEITTNHINAGIYVLEPETFDRIPSDVAWSIERSYFPSLIERDETFVAYVYDGYWIDIGTPEKYTEVHRDIMDGRF